MQQYLNLVFFNNTVLDYLIFIGSFALGILILTIFKKVVLMRLHSWSRKTKTETVDILFRGISKYLVPFLYLAVFDLCTRLLILNPTLAKIIEIVLAACMIILCTKFISSFIIFLFSKHWDKTSKNTDRQALKWISAIIRILIWIVALLLFLDNINVEISTLVASLGVGGIAIAFAAQAVLEDIFSFFTIFFDRPFEIGDFITVDDLSGTVEHIGMKTTRLQSLSGEQLIFSNKDLTGSRLRNYKRMQSRRILFTLAVQYDTPLEKLKEIPGLIKTIIESISNVRFDRAHFSEYSDYSLKFEIVYYVLSQDYNLYMDIQQEINFLIREEFDKRDIRFAFQPIHPIALLR